MAQFRVEAGHKEEIDLEVGPKRLLLRGKIVSMDASASVVSDGFVAIEGNRIVQVGPKDQPLPAKFAGIQPIETKGTIYPGLFELHNHPSYNAVPLWRPPIKYLNRKAWRADPRYKRGVANPASLLTHDPQSDNARSVIRFVECRALLGGVTTTQGLSVSYMDDTTKSAYRGLVRNLELPDDPSWPTAEDQINDFTSAAEAQKRYGSLLGDKSHPFIMHVSEGVDQDAHDVFQYLQQSDGSWLIGSNFVAVHGTGLVATQIPELSRGGGLIWSPLSNFLLYGETTKVEIAKAAGVPIALGSDWAPSGTKNLLGELKIAKLVGDQKGGLFSNLELVRMVTSTPAAIVGWDANFGSIEVGKIADLLILDDVSVDPYANLIAATETNVVGVLIDGRPRAGRASVLDPNTAGVELIRIANQDMVLDIIDNPAHPLAKTSLSTAIAQLSYALEHLPDLANKFNAQHALLDASSHRLLVHLDMDEEYARDLMSGAAKIGPGDVDPMELDPLTAVDDINFVPHLKANSNLPDWLRSSL